MFTHAEPPQAVHFVRIQPGYGPPRDRHLHPPAQLGIPFCPAPPLIQGESAEEYNNLLSRVTHAVGPTNVIEAVWVKDIVDLVWESQRLRYLKASLLIIARKAALVRLLRLNDRVMDTRVDTEHSALAIRWLSGDNAAWKMLTTALAEQGRDLESIMAQALSDKIRDIEQIDCMIASADARRTKVLTEIERRREAVARRLRAAAADITDVTNAT